MGSTLEFSTFVSQLSQAHLPSLRFALRLVVATGAYGDHLSDDNDRFLRIVGSTLLWQDSLRASVGERFSQILKHQTIGSIDAPSIVKLLESNECALWSAFHAEVQNAWQREPELLKRTCNEILAVLESDDFRHQGQHENLAHAASLYQLNALETEILQFAVTSRQWTGFRSFLKHMPMVSMGSAWGLGAAMVGCTESELKKALHFTQKLLTNQLVKVDRAPDQMVEFMNVGQVAFRLFLIHGDSCDGLRATFLEPITPTVLTQADFLHLSDEFNLIVECLKSAARVHESGVNILIQGPSGVGKTELARLLIQATGLAGFEVNADHENTDSSNEITRRMERFERMQGILQTHAGAAMVFEDVNDAAYHCETLLKERLDTCTTPTLWLCDESRPMSDSVLRRFVFHLNLNQAPISARRHLVSQVVSDFVIEPGALEAIAADHNLSPAQLSMAARFARLGANGDTALKAKALFSAIDSSQRAAGRTPMGLLQSAPKDSTWDIDALNLETSAPLSRILEGLHRTGCASLAFHGIPGTGKSSLAAYIANALDRPLLTKRVSDLSSKWIGETEKSIANMFREAASEGAVLLLDEGDSFLRDRSQARSSWEVTQVNELLQQIESFKGVFICATNLVENMDTAALRRFTFKIKFLPLDDLRRRRMLASYALSDANATLPRLIDDRLTALSQLAPGDFATVRRQEVLIDERFSLESWITELEREHAVRMPGAKRRAAFV